MLVTSNALNRTALADVKDCKCNSIYDNGKIVQKEGIVYAFITGTTIMVDFIQKLHESGIEISTLLDGTYTLNIVGWMVSIFEAHSCLFTPEK